MKIISNLYFKDINNLFQIFTRTGKKEFIPSNQFIIDLNNENKDEMPANDRFNFFNIFENMLAPQFCIFQINMSANGECDSFVK